MKISEAIKELSKLQEEVGDQDLLVIADSDSPEDALVQDEFRITISKLVDDDDNTGDPVPTILIPSYDKDVCLTEDKGLKRDVDKKVLRLIKEAENLILNELHGYGERARMHLLSARDVLIQRKFLADSSEENNHEPGPLSEISRLNYIDGFRVCTSVFVKNSSTVGIDEFIRVDQKRSEITFRLQNGPVKELSLIHI